MQSKINSYVFFDGVKEKEVSEFYDDWLSSCEFDDYIKSYVQIDSEKIYIFESEKRIRDFYLKEKELFNKLNDNLDFIIEENKIYNKKHRYDDYYVSIQKIKNEKYIVFYSLGGSRFVESITIYGFFIVG